MKTQLFLSRVILQFSAVLSDSQFCLLLFYLLCEIHCFVAEGKVVTQFLSLHRVTPKAPTDPATKKIWPTIEQTDPADQPGSQQPTCRLILDTSAGPQQGTALSVKCQTTPAQPGPTIPNLFPICSHKSLPQSFHKYCHFVRSARLETWWRLLNGTQQFSSWQKSLKVRPVPTWTFSNLSECSLLINLSR